MDVVQFQEFLAQLVSLQAAGLDAQHLIDEAKKAGKEEAEKAVVAPVEPVPVEDVTPFNQEQMDAFAKEKVDAAIAALPADMTPYAQADIDAAVAASSAVLSAKIAELELELSQKDADNLEEAVAAELMTLAQKLSARTIPAPVVESPVEAAPAVDAPVEPVAEAQV
jgi:hypothetical protein